MQLAKLLEALVQIEDVDLARCGVGSYEDVPVQRDPGAVTTALPPSLRAGVVDEHPPHGDRRDRQEPGTIFAVECPVVDEA